MYTQPCIHNDTSLRVPIINEPDTREIRAQTISGCSKNERNKQTSSFSSTNAIADIRESVNGSEMVDENDANIHEVHGSAKSKKKINNGSARLT